MVSIVACSFALDRRVREKFTPALRQADTTAPEPKAESPRTRIGPAASACRALAIACCTREAADRADTALPPRSRGRMVGTDRGDQRRPPAQFHPGPPH